jgi:ParB family transcriptional regulator, chromosome partitioning protein
MAKNSIETYGAEGKTNLLSFDPDTLELVTDEKHRLYDPRVHLPLSEEMVASIMFKGVTTPIVVWKDPETGKTCVVAGRQRVKNAREANKRLRKKGEEIKLVLARIERGTPESLMSVMAIENFHQALSPVEKAKLAQRLLESGYTEDQIPTLLHCSSATVKNLLALLDCSAAVRNAVEKGEIGSTHAVKLSKLGPAEQKERLEELRKTAPKGEGRKRRSKAAAKKAREVVSGKKEAPDGLRAENIVENVKRELEEKDVADAGSSALTRGAILALQWVLGDDEALKTLGVS